MKCVSVYMRQPHNLESCKCTKNMNKKRKKRKSSERRKNQQQQQQRSRTEMHSASPVSVIACSTHRTSIVKKGTHNAASTHNNRTISWIFQRLIFVQWYKTHHTTIFIIPESLRAFTPRLHTTHDLYIQRKWNKNIHSYAALVVSSIYASMLTRKRAKKFFARK